MKKLTLKLSLVLSSIILTLFFGFLIIKISQNKINVLGTSVIRIDRDNILFSKTSKLQYFYEPKPNEILSGRYSINSDTLNERFEYNPRKESGVYRIVTLGDSFTYGLFVNTQENYSEILEDLLNQSPKCENIQKFEVINLGVAGYDIQDAVERFRIRGTKYQPDLVIWLLKDDDFLIVREIVQKRAEEIFNNLSESEKRRVKLPEGDPTLQAMEEFHKQYDEKTILDFQNAYFQQFSQNYSGPLLIFTFPKTGLRFKMLMNKIYSHERPGIYYFETSDISLVNGLYPDGHPNVSGHKIIANDLFNYLYSQNNIICQK